VTPDPDVFFLPAPHGEQRLCIFHRPAGTPRQRLVYLHPFAEEMNKARRMAALACRALAAAGHAVLQIDLRGCGDSSADFGDAAWADWHADVRLAFDWMDRHCPADEPIWLWSLRAGALLAAQDWGRPVHHLAWQPTPAGKTMLQQFLRLKVAAELTSGGNKGLMDQLKQQLAAGQTVEIAGYALNPALAAGLEAARFAPQGQAGRLVWMELAQRDDAVLSPVAEQNLLAWREAGWAVQSTLTRGSAFWATTEIETAPALIDATVAAL
jgi:uncharacterized protein